MWNAIANPCEQNRKLLSPYAPRQTVHVVVAAQPSMSSRPRCRPRPQAMCCPDFSFRPSIAMVLFLEGVAVLHLELCLLLALVLPVCRLLLPVMQLCVRLTISGLSVGLTLVPSNRKRTVEKDLP
jgi:hypothetical protein